MSKKTLLLNSSWQVISFISLKKAIKLLFKNKAEVISNWKEEKIKFLNGFMYYPATIRLKYAVKIFTGKISFSKKLIFKRDRYTCAYCSCAIPASKTTIDHIFPKKLGGQNSFDNCVTACASCNFKKADKTLEESGMELKIKPRKPESYLFLAPPTDYWHDEWFFFVR